MSDEPVTLCEDCGRAVDTPPPARCDQPELHTTTDEPAPQPALAGDDLVRHLRSRLTYAEDQVQYATQLIIALLLQLPEPLARITDQQLDLAADGRVLQTWREDASGETVYRVMPR